MRLGILCLGVLAMAAAAHAQRNKDEGTEATKRACSVEECFFERDIREFEVIDQTHLIVYTGSQRCAFHVELRGTMCDLTFAPELYFSRRGDIPSSGITSGAEPIPRGPADPFDPLETSRRSDHALRVCSNDLAIQVTGGRFTESSTTNVATDRFGNPRTDCQVLTVTSITDDELVEFYVGRGVVPPLPPMGTGDIEVGDQEEQQEAGAESADAPQADAPKTRSRGRH
ncbi:MAG TPA: DUF6491 family protein [Gammaproteobacteria bacterium]|nr:DUF6491 family protein [Gammaproteobacteria bacterium]